MTGRDPRSRGDTPGDAERTQHTLTMWRTPSEEPRLEWATVSGWLAEAGAYWVTVHDATDPHPRPVWGVWVDDLLHLSIGSPTLAQRVRAVPVTVHLGSANEVAILDGRAGGSTTDPALVARYDAKYDWAYDPDRYGPLTTVLPDRVIAWESGGWAGREGVRATGRWTFTRAG